MPALYAHYRFGARVSRRLDGDLKDKLVPSGAGFLAAKGMDRFSE